MCAAASEARPYELLSVAMPFPENAHTASCATPRVSRECVCPVVRCEGRVTHTLMTDWLTERRPCSRVSPCMSVC